MNLTELAALAEVRNNLVRIVQTRNVPKALMNTADDLDKLFVEEIKKLDLNDLSKNNTVPVKNSAGAVIMRPKIIEQEIVAEKGQTSFKFVPPISEGEQKEITEAINKLSPEQKAVVGTAKGPKVKSTKKRGPRKIKRIEPEE